MDASKSNVEKPTKHISSPTTREHTIVPTNALHQKERLYENSLDFNVHTKMKLSQAVQSDENGAQRAISSNQESGVRHSEISSLQDRRRLTMAGIFQRKGL